jgi:hypothetical protein
VRPTEGTNGRFREQTAPWRNERSFQGMRESFTPTVVGPVTAVVAGPDLSPGPVGWAPLAPSGGGWFRLERWDALSAVLRWPARAKVASARPASRLLAALALSLVRKLRP